MKPINGKKQKKKQKVFNAKELFLKKENPIKEQIIWATVWSVVGFLLSIPFYFSGTNIYGGQYTNALNASSVIMLCVAALWALVKFGVMENSLYKFKKHKFKKFSQNYEVDAREDKEISIDEYRDFKKQQTYWGPITLAIFWAVIALITLIILLV